MVSSMHIIACSQKSPSIFNCLNAYVTTICFIKMHLSQGHLPLAFQTCHHCLPIKCFVAISYTLCFWKKKHYFACMLDIHRFGVNGFILMSEDIVRDESFVDNMALFWDGSIHNFKKVKSTFFSFLKPLVHN